MKKALFVMVSIIAFGIVNVCAQEKITWSHTGDTGPAHWGELSEAFKMCQVGKNQSPVNLTNMIEVDLEEISFNYQDIHLSVLNNTHTIEVDCPKGSQITIGNDTFALLQFHFHAPGEHQIEGQTFPLEVHLVHKDDQGDYAVIGVMFTEGKANPFLEQIWSYIPTEVGKQKALDKVKVNAINLLPEKKDYYRYNGSLTIPPCSEGLRWIVMKTPLTVSAEQLEQFKAVMHHDNNRPVQPINARFILK